MRLRLVLLAGVVVLVAAAQASAGPPSQPAHGACRPAIVTVGDISAATGYARTNLLTVPHRAAAAATGTAYVCDWELVHWSEGGWGEGRVSVTAFATPEDASAWFTSVTAAEKPVCKPVPYTATACVQISPIPPSGSYPFFQTVSDRFVVSIHMKQRRLNLRTLESLATRVLARAPQLP